MANQCTSKQEHIYNELWLVFEPFARGLDEERRTAIDGLIDVAARRLASEAAEPAGVARKP